MDLRRLGIALAILAVGLGLLALYAGRGNRQQPDEQQAAASAPASAPAAAPTETHAAPTTSGPVAASEPGEAPAPAPAAEADAATGEPTERWFGPPPQERFCTIGSLNDPNAFLIQVQVASKGAAVYTAKLTEYFVTVADKRLYEKDPAAYDAQRKADGEKYQGHYSVMNPVGPEGKQLLPLATSRLVVKVPDLPEADITLEGLDGKNWVLQEQTPSSCQFSYTLYRGVDWAQARERPMLKLTKTYTVREGDYTIYVSLGMENLSDRPLVVSLDQGGPAGLPEEPVRGEKRQATWGRYDAKDQKVSVQFKTPKDLQALPVGQSIVLGSGDGEVLPVVWAGVTNKYFAALMYPVPARGEELIAKQLAATYSASAVKESGASKTYATSISLPPVSLAPGEAAREVALEVFVGPKKRDLFSDAKAPGHREIYQKLGYLDTIEFGSCCTYAPLSFGMMWLLQVFSKITLGNYGVAIILLVFLVRIVLHPITKKGQVSMMKMSKLAPQMQKLKAKHANDKETLNKEMMKLYKQHGAGPFMGCLPMLLQMPIWVALFTGLNASVELRHAGFLPVWITDLSAPDAIWSWSAAYTLPVVGHTLNILPILLTIAMFLQTKMNPTMTQAAASPDQQQQQKMMQYMMPVMMLLFFYSAPSGLTLYIMSSTFAGVWEQKVIRKHIKDREAAAAATETTVKLPGKAFRGQRPKKPRGPFWTKRG